MTLRVPHLARDVDGRRDPAARAGPDRRPDGQGRLRRARLLAGRRCAARRRRRPGSSRRCWSRWPTTASPRPRSPPGSPTSPRPTRCRARWPPGCSAAAPGSSASPRTAAASCTPCSTEHDGDLPDRRRRLGRARPRRRAPRPARPAGSSRASGHPVHKVGDPRTPRADRDRRARRACAARTCGCSRRSAGCTRRCSAARLPLNGAGVCGAALADLGLPVELLRGFALLARAAGLLGQIAEERRRPIGDGRLPAPSTATPSYVDPDADRPTPTRGAAHGHRRRGHRLDPPPLLLPGQHRHRRRPAAVRRRVGRPRSRRSARR